MFPGLGLYLYRHCRAGKTVTLLFPRCYLAERVYGWTEVTWIFLGIFGLREAAKKKVRHTFGNLERQKQVFLTNQKTACHCVLFVYFLPWNDHQEISVKGLLKTFKRWPHQSKSPTWRTSSVSKVLPPQKTVDDVGRHPRIFGQSGFFLDPVSLPTRKLRAPSSVFISP